ncbi:MAG TPA: Holliday junction branch migration protein RuvA, partial [Candidatus Saccharimonadia bacterium]|nr:Holliday junction branch migration protein RuvA [Candidatus Saccharimonadia bacterium]
LSGMPVSQFKDNVIRNDIAALSKISGVGKKTAERIVLELKDKVGIVSTWQAAQSTASLAPDPTQTVQTDAVLALIALGFKQADAQKTVQDLMKKAGADAASITVAKLIRDALRGM